MLKTPFIPMYNKERSDIECVGYLLNPKIFSGAVTERGSPQSRITRS